MAEHRYAAGRAFAMMRDRPVAFLLSVILAASALALPLVLGSVLWAARPALAGLQPAPEISVFVSPRAGTRDMETLKVRLAAAPDVTAVTLRPKEAALAQLIKRAGFTGTPSELGTNPLPDVLIARLTPSVAPAAVERLTGEVKGWPLVDGARSDLDWYRKVQAIARVAVNLLSVFGGLVLVVVALILIGTVRLHAATRSDEVAVLKLVGATPAFIVRPYAYSAALTLVVAAALAAAVVYATHATLAPAVLALTALYGSPLSLPGPEPAHVVAVLLGAAVFGWLVGAIGARMATGSRP